MTDSMLEKAIEIAVQAHLGQADKAGEPYVLHVLRVMLRMADETEMTVGVLHDIIEDTRWTAADLAAEGFPRDIVRVVELLSRDEGESYEDFISRLAQDPVARRVKVADLEDNMDLARLKTISQDDWRRLKKYQRARRALIQWNAG